MVCFKVKLGITVLCWCV